MKASRKLIERAEKFGGMKHPTVGISILFYKQAELYHDFETLLHHEGIIRRFVICKEIERARQQRARLLGET